MCIKPFVELRSNVTRETRGGGQGHFRSDAHNKRYERSRDEREQYGGKKGGGSSGKDTIRADGREKSVMSFAVVNHGLHRMCAIT